MHSILKKTAMVCTAALLTASIAHAEGGLFADENFSGNVALTSDYVWRGISQTNRSPAISSTCSQFNFRKACLSRKRLMLALV